MKKHIGFTLTEILIVMSITAILIATAIPGFRTQIEKQKLRSAKQELIQLAQLARTTAVNENHLTVICGSTQGEQCDNNTAWHGHVIAFKDNDNNHARSTEEPLLYRQRLGEDYIQGTRPQLEFNASGAGYMGSWVFCTAEPSTLPDTFSMIVSLGGRIRTATTDWQRCG